MHLAQGLLIAQISDAHVVAPGLKTCGVAPAAENLARCVESINSQILPPDLVIVSGDVTDGGSRAEARHAADILARLECPFHVVPGNHDDRSVLRDVFGDAACPSPRGGFVSYVIEGHPLRVIAMDSVRQGQAGGELCAERLGWLRDTLAAGGGRPTVIFMHHPPLKCGVPETDQDGFAGAGALGRIVAAHPCIERILCGHIHLQTHARWNGTIVTTAPSTGMQLGLDLTQAGESRFLLSDPAYLLHHWTPDRVLVTHSIRANDPQELHDFSRPAS